MPQPTVEEFWSLLARSGLVDGALVESLRLEQPTACDGTVPGIAAWLVGRGLITGWQARRLSVANVGPFFLGDYRLLERLDREGEALRFTARHDPSGRVVDLVLLNARRCRRIHVWTAIVDRTNAASRAIDPMLSRTWTLEEHESSRMIVCEHVEGRSLAGEIERHGPLPVLQAGVLVAQVARAVAELHRLGSVHGGLSPHALLREPSPGRVPRTGRVRLLQFPLAGDPHRVPLRPWTDDTELAALGKEACYVAPELQLPGTACDERSDVYSIGAILYALLSGAHPGWAGTPEATLRRTALQGPSPLGPPAVTPPMAKLVGHLMDRDPARRCQTAEEAGAAIAGCLGISLEPVVAVERPAAAGRRRDPPPPAPETPQDMPPAVTGAVVAAAAADAPDFTALAAALSTPPKPVPGTDPGRPPQTRAAAPARPVRRRAAWLAWVGGAVTLAIVAGTALLVASRIESSKPPDVVASAPRSPGVKPPPPSEPIDSGVEGWGEAPPTGAAKPASSPDDVPAAMAAGGASGGTAAVSRQIVVDDPVLPWASPTTGPRPRLAHLPPGAQLVLLARPAAVLADDEGRLFLRALGPEVDFALRQLAAWCGCEVAEIESVQAGWQAGDGDEVVGGYAVRLVEGRSVPRDAAARHAAWGDTQAADVEGETIHRGGGFSFWVPSTESDRVLVVTSESRGAGPAAGAGPAPVADEPLMEQIVRRSVAARGGGAALEADLPRDLEELVAMLDADRHVTLFGSPHYLLGQGRGVLAGPLARLAEPIEDLFGESVRAASLSAHFADNCYLEMDAIATLDVPAKRMARELAGRVDGLADSVERYCANLDPSPYGRLLVLRLPQMLRFLSANTRSGAEGKGVVLNAWLPRHAGHNLALASELALAQSPGAGAAPPPAAGPPAAGPPAGDALGRLGRPITLVFAKDTLEKSIQMISEEIDVPMDILGPDLQLEGITKNQSFGIEARDKPARDVLLEILARANPDGKLVYIVRKEEGVETILVTTRAAVQKRGDALPPGLEAPPGR